MSADAKTQVQQTVEATAGSDQIVSGRAWSIHERLLSLENPKEAKQP